MDNTNNEAPHDPVALPGQKVVTTGKPEAPKTQAISASPDSKPKPQVKTPAKKEVKKPAAPKAPARPKSKASPKSKPAPKTKPQAAKKPSTAPASEANPKSPTAKQKLAEVSARLKAVVAKGKPTVPNKDRLTKLPEPKSVVAASKPKIAHKKTGASPSREKDTPEIAQLIKAREKIRNSEGATSPSYKRLSSNINYLRHPEVHREAMKRNRVEYRARDRERYQNDESYRERVLKNSAKWREKNQGKMKQYNEARKQSPQYRKTIQIRNCIAIGLKTPKTDGGRGPEATQLQKVLGCTKAEFRSHIEKQFTKGMKWDNFRQAWSYQFKEGMRKFDLSKPPEFAKAANYKNVQVVALEE